MGLGVARDGDVIGLGALRRVHCSEACSCGHDRKAGPMFHPVQALFFEGGDHLSVGEQRRGGVSVECVESQNEHQWLSSRNRTQGLHAAPGSGRVTEHVDDGGGPVPGNRVHRELRDQVFAVHLHEIIAILLVGHAVAQELDPSVQADRQNLRLLMEGVGEVDLIRYGYGASCVDGFEDRYPEVLLLGRKQEPGCPSEQVGLVQSGYGTNKTHLILNVILLCQPVQPSLVAGSAGPATINSQLGSGLDLAQASIRKSTFFLG